MNAGRERSELACDFHTDVAALALSIVRQQAAPPPSTDAAESHLVVSVDLGERPTISKHIFGLFVEHLGRCVYEGLVARDGSHNEAIVQALRELRVPNLRWPGGCFADQYHWRDGIGPAEARPATVNKHWGGGVEENSFGTAEFMALCEAVGCEPYVVGNVGSGSVREMSEWLEYVSYGGDSSLARLRAEHGRSEPWAVRFWGVGNESWGCGGNMDAATYAAEYKRYATLLQKHGPSAAPPLCRIACGANGRDVSWTEGMMRLCKRGSNASGDHFFHMEGLSLHLYVSTRREGLRGDEGTEGLWFTLMLKAAGFAEALAEHVRAMDLHDPKRKAVNVLHAPLRTSPAGGAVQRTPTYHALRMLAVHHDATRLHSQLTRRRTYNFGASSVPRVDAIASSGRAARSISLSVVHTHPHAPTSLSVELRGLEPVAPPLRLESAAVLTGSSTGDTECVPAALPASATTWSAVDGRLRLELPPRSLVVVTLSH